MDDFAIESLTQARERLQDSYEHRGSASNLGSGSERSAAPSLSPPSYSYGYGDAGNHGTPVGSRDNLHAPHSPISAQWPEVDPLSYTAPPDAYFGTDAGAGTGVELVCSPRCVAWLSAMEIDAGRTHASRFDLGGSGETLFSDVAAGQAQVTRSASSAATTTHERSHGQQSDSGFNPQS